MGSPNADIFFKNVVQAGPNNKGAVSVILKDVTIYLVQTFEAIANSEIV